MAAGGPPSDLGNSSEWQLDVEQSRPESAVGSQESEPNVGPFPADASAPTSDSRLPTPEHEAPPSPEQLIEAMLFVGGHPLTAPVACSTVRGLTQERFLIAVDALTRQYRRERRPYSIHARDDGFVLTILPSYRALRERLFGGPREARLSQPALDVLSIVAYRQPVEKVEVDSMRGIDSGAILRQLVRLGLVAVQHRAEAGSRAVRYGTTPRFLQLFNLGSLDELPRLGDTALV
jgi:segregation and condensation protein B